MSDEKKSSSADILNTLGDLLKKVAAEAGNQKREKSEMDIDIHVQVVDLRKEDD